MKASYGKKQWTRPAFIVHGPVEGITAQGKRNGFADVPFPQDSPDLTASEPR